MIQEGCYNLENDILVEIQNKLRNQEIESCKKGYQEKKL
jgi:hypothetical protein